MLRGYEKIRVPDENKENDIIFEVNWNPHDERSKDCKLIRITAPGGKMALVKREHLNAVLFATGTEKDQRDLIPQTITRVRNFETMLGITASKNIAKGEKINVRVKIPLPALEEEVVYGVRKDLQRRGKLLG